MSLDLDRPKDEAETARQTYIEKRSANQKVEELDWTL
jgi:hypothetical protein